MSKIPPLLIFALAMGFIMIGSFIDNCLFEVRRNRKKGGR